ncbi:MAG: LytTR family transcriptional regulator [Clostridia bacterium]|nr:LytTR family transcriptional regulator [Clostridia bacterium]
MLKLRLFETPKGKERVDIYYSEMTPAIKQIVTIAKDDKPVLYGTCEDEKVLLDIKEICYFDTVDRRTFAYTGEHVYQVAKSLSILEEELRTYGFIRINKANLVNIYMIRKIKPEANMRISAVLKTGEKLQINRAYKKEFEEYLNEIRRML